MSAADGDTAGKIEIFKSATGEHLRTIDGKFKGFCWIPESPNLVVTRDEDGTHAMYNVDTGEHVREFAGNFAIGRPHVDSTGKVLTSIGKDFTVRAWDVDSGQVINKFSLGQIRGGGNVRRQSVAFGTRRSGRTVIVWLLVRVMIFEHGIPEPNKK